MDYERFYKEFVPKSCLPSEYGGDLESMEELHKKHSVSLMQLREYFLFEERMMNFEMEEYEFDAAAEEDEATDETRK